jgi:hypothetical protein
MSKQEFNEHMAERLDRLYDLVALTDAEEPDGTFLKSEGRYVILHYELMTIGPNGKHLKRDYNIPARLAETFTSVMLEGRYVRFFQI